MNKKAIIFILAIGICYRLMITSGGNFLFNMDNARDFVDVREMVELHKLRLTGPSSAIEGLYNGPAWYYLLAIPYLLTGGHPYGAIIMEIVLWAVGGFFLLKLVKSFGTFIQLVVGSIWVSSNYIVLTNLYSFNPNPVTLLTPLFIYLLVKYIEEGKKIFIILCWLLGGLFFNLEMNIGIFTPVIITLSIFIADKKYFKDKYFYLGALVFAVALLPQILFDYKHQFIMSNGVIRFLSEHRGGTLNPFLRFKSIWDSYYQTFQATLMNHKLLTTLILLLSIPAFKKNKMKEDYVVLVSALFVLVPFIGYLIIPVSVNPWHLGGPMSALIILTGFVIFSLKRINFFGRVFSLIFSLLLLFYSITSILHFLISDFGKPSTDSSVYKNEIAAIDFVYKYANGKNFKVYAYLPSVYDYPYQYLIWWHGKKEYGYLPIEYSYGIGKKAYISNKDNFSPKDNEIKKREDSNLVFFIKEPNQNYTRFGWEGDFIKYEPINKRMVGPLEIEIRKDLTRLDTKK